MDKRKLKAYNGKLEYLKKGASPLSSLHSITVTTVVKLHNSLLQEKQAPHAFTHHHTYGWF